jgi:hypothetical protein
MAIKIPILTSFDPKGLKQANAAFAGLQSSIGSLGSNFAIAGTAIVGATALLGKAVMSASNFEAEFEGVNQVFKQAATSVQAFAESAAQTAGLSATEALRASKTFGLFATTAGLSTTEAAKFSTTLVQLAGDLGSFNDLPTADALAAIQSGLQGQAEPLAKYGVFLNDLSLKQALFNATGEKVTGTLTAQQKMVAAYSQILADTGVQQGDFVKYQETLGNQLKEVGAEFQNLIRDIGLMLIPVITEAMPLIKEMALELGEKLKAAIATVDWKSLTTTIVNLASFFLTNAENIAKFVVAIFALNTAFKLMTVTSGLATVAIKLQGWFTAQLATGMSVATVATTLLSAAMRLIPFVAVASAIGLVINGIIVMGDQANKTGGNIRLMNGEIVAGADAAPANANKYVKVAGGFKLIETAADGATKAVNDFKKYSGPARITQAEIDARLAGRAAGKAASTALPDFSSLFQQMTGGAGSSIPQVLDGLNDAQAEAARKEQEILDKRESAFKSFNESVKSLFGQIKESILSSFNLPTLGNSVNSITRNIAKLLEKTKSFATNISKLSGLGLNSALLQQVIQAGPMAGGQLASALVGGGSGFIEQINSAYGEMGNLAGGIAGVATAGAFNNRATVNNYSIEVTGGLATGSDVGRAVVNAIKDYERQSGAAWRA